LIQAIRQTYILHIYPTAHNNVQHVRNMAVTKVVFMMSN